MENETTKTERIGVLPIGDSCDDCLWFCRDDDVGGKRAKTGRCLRRPPVVVVVGNEIKTAWPKVRSDYDVCGEGERLAAEVPQE